MTGRVCLVTGATSGIGKATALGLARLGATIGLVARDKERGEATAGEIRAATGSPVEVLLCDLSVQASVRELAREALTRFEHLHVLVNNAGVSLRRRSLTPDGLETTFAVNHLAPFLLTNLLLERLEASAPARLVTVTSTAFRHGQIRFDDLQGERSWSGIRAYNQSKLANVLFTLELARRLEGTGVTANCSTPAFTDFEQPRRLASTTHLSAMEIRGSLTFDPVPEGTRMRWQWNLDPRGLLKLLDPLLARVGRRQEQEIWSNLKRLLEAPCECEGMALEPY